MGTELIVGGPQESLELDLGNRTQPVHGQTYRGADDSGFGKRGVHDSLASESLVESFRDPEDASVGTDVLSQNHDAIILFHFLDKGEIDCLDEC
jgi:hypothetical protein